MHACARLIQQVISVLNDPETTPDSGEFSAVKAWMKEIGAEHSSQAAVNSMQTTKSAAPRDLGKLLSPHNEWLAEPCAESARPLLESLKGSSKAEKLAKAILARTPLDPGKRAEVNQLAADARLRRGARLRG